VSGTLNLRMGHRVCSFSNPVSRCDLLTCDDASCLTRCHRVFVSNSCHFFRTRLSIPWRHIQSLRDADQPVRKVPSRDGYPARRWEMKDLAAQCIWHHQSWIPSIIHQKGLRFHQMNHDWFYSAPSMISSSGDENGAYAAALETSAVTAAGI